MATVVTPGVKDDGTKPQPHSAGRGRPGVRPTQHYGTFLVNLVETDGRATSTRPASANRLEIPEVREGPDEDSDATDADSMAAAVSQRSTSPSTITPRRSASNRRRRQVHPGYDARLDSHKQTYVLSPTTIDALRRTMKNSHQRIFHDPNKDIALHGPRRPLLLSYPVKPSTAGKAIYVTRSPGEERLPHLAASGSIPDTDEARDFVRLAYHLRTGATRLDEPIPKKLRRPKTVAPAQTKVQLLAKEKAFILDGIALSNIQDDYAKVQPKLGPAIPPYNSHFDKHVKNYFAFKGVNKTLRRTGQVREYSQSTQGKAVDRFHYIGDGHIYIQKRNRSGAGYSRDLVDGHGQFLAEARPMSSYNGRFGFRRNTPLLRNCPSPFGTASRSPTH